jgi:hypothetical protein
MNFKPHSNWWPAGLLLIAGSAYADLSPYSASVTETIEHESNVFHSAQATADWLSTTELRAGVDQTLGRGRLLANAAFDLDRYKRSRLDDSGYDLSGEFDWSTVYDLSGSFGADTSKKQYVYGLDGEQASQQRNSQKTDHVFARGQLGGVSRWTLFGGADASQRKYTAESFAPDEVHQWSVNGGSRYQTSPDLSFGVVGNYTKGAYPHAVLSIAPTEVIGSDSFSVKSVDATSTLQASGNSSFDLRAGYTVEDNAIQPQRKYWNGDLKWSWTAGGRLKFLTELERDSDADTTIGAGSGVASNNVTGHSLNSTARLDVTYELTAKINLDAGAQYTQRRYYQGALPILAGQAQPSTGSGSNRTNQFSVAAHYQPIINTDLSCSFTREVRRVDPQIALFTPAYSANNALCAVQVQFR